MDVGESFILSVDEAGQTRRKIIQLDLTLSSSAFTQARLLHLQRADAVVDFSFELDGERVELSYEQLKERLLRK